MKLRLLNVALAAVFVGGAAHAQSGYFTGRLFSGPVYGGYNGATAIYVGPAPIRSFGNQYLFGPAAQSGNTYADLLAQEAVAANTPDIEQAAYNATQIPRRSDTIAGSIDKDGKLFVTWKGEPTLVDRVRFAVLDKDKKVISEQVITKLPVQARFTLTNKTAYYRTKVEYVNGTTTNVVSPL